jgi:hypothetical protein
MAKTINRRMSAEINGGFVLFLIGMRFNRPWKIGSWLPVFLAMPKMLRELSCRPELGLLHYRLQFGFPDVMVVQYWKSFTLLNDYAAMRDAAHLPAWAAFNKAIGTNGDVGIWHETYKADPGQYEAIYVNMPPYGLGAAGEVFDAKGERATAAKRMAQSRPAAPEPAAPEPAATQSAAVADDNIA